jgi:deoxyadenosine/deoxycytidine kinase
MLRKVIGKSKKKTVLESNAVAIGGMIALGKTTLVNNLQKRFTGSKAVWELDNEDPLQKMLLEGLYKRTISAEFFQLYFVTKRFENYKNNILSHPESLLFFDRTIFEDRLFAHQNMLDRPIQFTYYDRLWQDMCNELLYLVGTPKIYIILDADFATFKDRIFKRDRKEEIENWEKNEDYFKALHKHYIPFMNGICKMYGIKSHVIDTVKLNAEQVADEAYEVIMKVL